jgi:hypothetical protein
MNRIITLSVTMLLSIIASIEVLSAQNDLNPQISNPYYISKPDKQSFDVKQKEKPDTTVQLQYKEPLPNDVEHLSINDFQIYSTDNIITIKSLKETQKTILVRLYTLDGKEISSGYIRPGIMNITINPAKRNSCGIYFITLKAINFEYSRKILLH